MLEILNFSMESPLHFIVTMIIIATILNFLSEISNNFKPINIKYITNPVIKREENIK